MVVSSAPQIRYPDCYGIDMAKLEDFVAFRAALSLHKERGSMDLVDAIYKKCKARQDNHGSSEQPNHGQRILRTLLHTGSIQNALGFC